MYIPWLKNLPQATIQATLAIQANMATRDIRQKNPTLSAGLRANNRRSTVISPMLVVLASANIVRSPRQVVILGRREHSRVRVAGGNGFATLGILELPAAGHFGDPGPDNEGAMPLAGSWAGH